MQSREAAAIWREAADLIDNFGWCKKVIARDPSGRAVMAESPSACRFCVLGAIHRALAGGARIDFAGRFDRSSAVVLLVGFADYLKAKGAIPEGHSILCLAEWNDSRPNRVHVVRPMRAYAAHLEERARGAEQL